MTPKNNPPLTLQAKNLFKSYKRPIVYDVSFEIKQGEIIGLLGPNGAGKTTAFYMMIGLIKPDKGTIKLNTHNITFMPMYQRARLGIGYLPQEASIFRGLNVEDNIMAVLEVVEPNAQIRETRLEQLILEFNIEHVRKSPARTLSGGERRRCEIARTLATNPQFILFDEPFAGIDPIAVREIRELIIKLQQQGIGILITDHNVREALRLVERAYILYEGHIIIEGAPQEIIHSKKVQDVYLGTDFEGIIT